METFTPQFFLTVFHLIGVAVGVGGAFFGDSLFFSATKNGIVSAQELRLLKRAGRFVWVGLFIIAVSGLGLFLLDFERYMASSKFLAKMLIVLVVALNGIVFHTVHVPKLRRLVGVNLRESQLFKEASGGLFASGAVSVVSWLSALTLGSVRSLPFTLGQIMGAYALALAVAVLGASIMRCRFLRGAR